MKLKHFPNTEIESYLSLHEVMQSVRSGIIQAENGVFHIPERMHLSYHSGTYLVMPAMGEDYYCTKLVSVTPDNAKREEPVINGVPGPAFSI